jgi:hypothetical protein
MGARFRLKASKDISALPAQAKAIAQAMKTYGIIVADNGSNWYVSGVPNDNWIDPQLKQLQNYIRGSDFEAVDVSSLMVSPTSGEAKQRPVSIDTTSSANPSAPGNVTITTTLAGDLGPATGTVTFSTISGDIAGCVGVPVVAGAAACVVPVTCCINMIGASYSGNAVYAPAYDPVFQVGLQGTQLSLSPPSLAFGGQSINTTSPTQAVTLTNNSGSTVTIQNVSQGSSDFVVASETCTQAPIANGAGCTLVIGFRPGREGPRSNAIGLVYSVGGNGATSGFAATGTGEKSLVTHFYRAILRRAPDAPGKTFWEGEATRLQSIGANVNETWFAMAQFFFFSAEYLGFARSDTEFVTDLYNTFFNRAPDGPGLAFWSGQLSQGMPREVLLAQFMFSPEFATFAQAIFGNTAAAAEVDTVMDFYRGMLARTPDQGGFDFWVAQFRTAQCQGAGQVYAQVESISSQFATGGEYLGKNRTNAQYVGDLYNAFLRRGGDLGGVQFWIGQLGGAMTREQVRQNFIASAEFQGRVASVVNQGCLP